MKISIRWGTVCFFSLMLAMAACGSDDSEPTPSDNTGGSGGSAGSSDDAGTDPDANGEDDAGDDPDSGDPDAGDDADTGKNPDDEGCSSCAADPARCGSQVDACVAIQACKDAFDSVETCLEQAQDGDASKDCLDRFTTDGGQAAEDLLACVVAECATECNFE